MTADFARPEALRSYFFPHNVKKYDRLMGQRGGGRRVLFGSRSRRLRASTTAMSIAIPAN